MSSIERNGYVFKPVYSNINGSGLLHIFKDGALVRELHFPCETNEPSQIEVEKSIHYFFENLAHEHY